jgi:hypothetical protein
LPPCTSVKSFRVQVTLVYPNQVTRSGETSADGSSRNAVVRVNNLPDGNPSLYQVTVTGALDFGYFAQPDTGTGNIFCHPNGLMGGFGGFCSGGTLSCGSTPVCGAGCQPISYTDNPNRELKVKAVWGLTNPLPLCIKINEWTVRIRLTFPDNSTEERSARVAGSAHDAIFTISNAPASNASVRVTVKPVPATSLIISGVRREQLH